MEQEQYTQQVILIQAHRDLQQLRRLISYFEGKCDIFIHVDKKSCFTREERDGLAQMPGVKGVYRKYSVHWAGFSILRCELFLLEEALKHSEGSYFHLLSGQDYPLRPLNEFMRFFHETVKEGYVKGSHMPFPQCDDNTFFRIQYFVPTDWVNGKSVAVNRKLFKLIDWQKKLGIRRGLPRQFEHLYCGSAWFSISRRSAKYLVDYTRKRPSFFRRLNFTFYPEEMYVNTVLLNSEFGKDIANVDNGRCILWNNPGHDHSPLNLTESHLPRILKYGTAFFARKLEWPSCEKLMGIIDRYMCTEPSGKVTETGCWQERSFSVYDYDYGLSRGIVFLCRTLGLKTVLDLGCGPGYYVSDLHKEHIVAVGYDGNPYTEELSGMILAPDTPYPCGQVDVTEEIAVAKPYDLVLFLNVGEYVLERYEDCIMRNLKTCAGRYLIVNWADTVADERTVNPMTEENLVVRLNRHGFVVDKLATRMLRDMSGENRHKQGTVVFRKSGWT